MKKVYVLLLVSMIMVSFQNFALAGRECDCLKDAVEKAVEKAAVKGGCGAIGLAFNAACSTATGGVGAPECTVGSCVLGAYCKFFGKKFVKGNAKEIANDICDYVYPDDDLYIPVENHLKKHEVDFRAVISNGDDVHLRGDNWLKAEEIGILASHKLEGKNFNGTVKARVKRSLKKDIHLSIHHVQPNKHRVYVYSKNGGYHIGKEKLSSFGIYIPIENHLNKHEIDFRAVIDNSPDVHLPGNNWLKANEKAILYSYKLYKNSNTVKARIKRAGEKDITKTINHVIPGVDIVYVDYRDGHYHIKKKKITTEFYLNRTIPVENHLQKHKVDFRVVIDNGPDVHLPGDNWLKADKKGILASQRLFRDKYTVKARVKISGNIDKHLSIDGIKPGQDKVYVYYKNNEYRIGKHSIK